MSELVDEAMAHYWGDKCPDYAPDCPICKAWAQLEGKDKLIAELRHLLQDAADGVTEADGRGDDGIIDMQIVRDIQGALSKSGPR